jgi:hypothetical protein
MRKGARECFSSSPTEVFDALPTPPVDLDAPITSKWGNLKK